MKKKLLFVTLYLQTGGVERSLLSLLNSLDYTKYEVDLLLFDHSGVLFNMVPKEVNILPPLFETYSEPFRKALPILMKKAKIRLLAGKLLAPTLAMFSKGVGTSKRWAVYRHILPATKKHYDVAISYLDFFTNYYVTELVKADRKIVYNHMDYNSQVGWQCPKLDKKSFETSDFIVTVAESSRKSLEANFPIFRNKIKIIHNSVSSEEIRKLSIECQPFQGNQWINIVTVARLVEEKGVLDALEACKQLVEKKVNFKWYIVGNGPLRDTLQTRARELNISNYFILIGEKDNPYPYIGQCDVYVQPSRTEAHCVAVEEAIALFRPIVVTNIPSFNEQIIHNETGIIVNPSSTGIAEGVYQLLQNNELRDKLSSFLFNLNGRNKDELQKFYKLMAK